METLYLVAIFSGVDLVHAQVLDSRSAFAGGGSPKAAGRSVSVVLQSVQGLLSTL